MGIEIQILDVLQKIHTPLLDKCMIAITSWGNAGIIGYYIVKKVSVAGHRYCEQ